MKKRANPLRPHRRHEQHDRRLLERIFKIVTRHTSALATLDRDLDELREDFRRLEPKARLDLVIGLVELKPDTKGPKT